MKASGIFRLGVVCVLLGGLACGATAQAGGGAIRNHFDSDAPLRAPAFFDFAVLGIPGKADWMVTSDMNPPSAPNDVSQTIQDRPEGSIAVALRRNVSLRDGRLSVALKQMAGHAGMVFRMAGEKDFLALLVDLTKGDARLVSYRDGKPTELASGKVAFVTPWGTLGVTLHDAEVRVVWGGKPVLSASDPAPAAGRVGMATSGPGAVTFDEFIIEPAEQTPNR
jgi:hypothetical protein